jgi:hypothetical protein
MSDMFFEIPKGRCDTCPVDPNFWITDGWKVKIKKV